jgi:divalent metal cation (Fe/Co/Zn/Cd) transporter
VQRLKKEILSQEGVLKMLSLKARKAGPKLFLETTVQVPNSMSLEEAHALASRIEARLAAALGNVDATIHIEPSERDAGMEQLVAQLAAVEGVREVHEISTVYAAGKLYLTLHVCVDSQLSVKEAHDIAERVEDRLHSGIKQLENVTVHMEPVGDGVRAKELTDEELKQIIHKVAKDVEQKLRCKRILVYRANGKRYVSLDCAFTGHIALAEAHEIASKIEKEVRERFADAVVTVHVEPDVGEKD